MKRLMIVFMLVLLGSVSYFSMDNNRIYAFNEKEISEQLLSNSIESIVVYNDLYSQSQNYYSTYNQWKDLGMNYGSDIYNISPRNFLGGFLDTIEGEDVVRLEPLDEISFEVFILEGGLYQIYLDYYVLNETKITPKISVEVNGEFQYSELNSLDLKVEWKTEDIKKYDRYGDELTPESLIDQKWYRDLGLTDPNFFFLEPLLFSLDSGINEIKFTLQEGYVMLGDVNVENRSVESFSYEEYLSNNPFSGKGSNSLITIEAEDVSSKSKQSIRSKYMRDPQVTPYEYKTRVLNVLDGYSYGEAGDVVTYSFSVRESGYYNFAIKYYSSINNGLPSFRRISVDGNTPFIEFENYKFLYETRWVNEVLKDENNVPYNIYLEEGIHTISLSVDNEDVRDIYHNLLDLLKYMQDIAREINKITGGLDDKDRDWDITSFLPNLESDLEYISNQLETSILDIEEYSGLDDIAVLTELKIAKDLIDKFIEDPDELPSYMSKFTEGENSAYSRINIILPSLIYNPLHMDKIFVYSDSKLPNANANIFVRGYEGIKAFLYSFFDPKYNDAAEVDDETIEIWVNKSRLYVEIMQRMIDDEFTPETGVKVQLSIMPDENKIILSNAAGTTPDGVLGISFQKPFEFAIRGIVEDLSKYEGFYDLTTEFNPNTFIQYVYEDGVYAIPETQDVKLLFYRKDILSQLGVAPPDTWEEVVSLVPVLQKYDLNFYVPIGEENSYKGLDKTTPFIYQFGGSLYNEDDISTSINVDGAYEAFELMTDLFTVYNLPITTSNFFQHFRTGIIPVGIGDANTYIQLKYAAPELAGQWGVLPIPGVENEDRIVERWDPTYGSSSILFSDSKKKLETWELIRWWSSKDVQADFSFNIQATLGSQFLYMTANIEGFKQSAWPTDTKSIILEQWTWIQSTGKVPGDYMLERELSNAWNKVVFQGMHPRIAIDEAKLIIDRELERKLNEFGYMDEYGNILKEYRIPTMDNIDEWLKEYEN